MGCWREVEVEGEELSACVKAAAGELGGRFRVPTLRGREIQCLYEGLGTKPCLQGRAGKRHRKHPMVLGDETFSRKLEVEGSVIRRRKPWLS